MLRYEISTHNKEQNKEYARFLRLKYIFMPKITEKPRFCLYSPVDYNAGSDSIIIGFKEKVQSNPDLSTSGL